jgi:hypothetical protein
MLGALMAPAGAASSADSGNIHVDKIVVVPNGPNLNFTVYYDSDFFTKVFSFIFGSRVIQPSILHIFDNFTNVTVLSIDSNNGVAQVVAKNQLTLSDNGWYIYGGNATFTTYVDVLEVHSSDGSVLTINNTNALPVISNFMPMYNNST